MNKFIKILSITAILCSCSGIYTRMANSDLEIKTNMTKTIWLTPTDPAQTKIYVQARNTSDNKEFNDLGTYIKSSLESKGYTITNNPNEATFILQTNVLKAILNNNSVNKSNTQNDALTTAVGVGYAVGSKNDDLTAVGAGLAAGLASMYFDAKTKDATYYVQTDIKITEGNKSYTTSLNVDAKKVNLTVEEASIKMKEAIANSLSGLF